ncbi:hypothetical protein [Mucilaginibacter defluvii]|uniref:AIPR protein n=1 Tax=Mucilaginibacter defluvii TaxID=1196019 RepID=A0ABP9G9A2_9SPHI
MAHYYYPLSTRDFAFENIFSSESVSPASYYAKRAFGFDYFPVLPAVNNDEAILLFSKPPAYEDPNNAKFILKIAEGALNPAELVFIAEGVFAYYNTIYLDKGLASILFFSAKDIRMAILKANTSLPTKVAEKYIASFEIISNADCRVFPPVLPGVVRTDEDASLKIILDKRFNHFKGFIYGLVIGHIANDRKKERGLKMRFQEITNAFAELKSRIDSQQTVKGKGEIHLYIEKLFRAVNIAEIEHDQFQYGSDVDEDLLVEYLLSKLSRLKTAKDVNHYLDIVISNDELLGSSNYKTILDDYLLNRRSSVGHFIELRRNIQQFIDVFQSATRSVHSADEINNRIKLLLKNTADTHQEQLSARTYDLRLDLTSISYDIVENKVTFNMSQSYLNATPDNEFTFIINAILKFAKSNKGPARKEMILKIVEEVGSSYTKGGKETLLYQYLENRIDVYSLEKASNLIMKNFVAFTFNPDSLEKLDDFLMSKSVEERWMAYTFWGAYNGFANISRNYTADIFSSQNLELQEQIDQYLRQFILTVVNTKPSVSDTIKVVEVADPVLVIPDQAGLEDSLVGFFNLQVANHYKLSLEEFAQVVKLTQQKDFQDELKSKYQIAKKESLKLFNAVKKYFDPNALFR